MEILKATPPESGEMRFSTAREVHVLRLRKVKIIPELVNDLIPMLILRSYDVLWCALLLHMALHKKAQC